MAIAYFITKDQPTITPNLIWARNSTPVSAKYSPINIHGGFNQGFFSAGNF